MTKYKQSFEKCVIKIQRTQDAYKFWREITEITSSINSLVRFILTFIVNFFQFLVLFPSCRLLSSFFCFRNINCGQSIFFPILCDFSVCWWTDFTGGLTGVTQRHSPSESFFKVFQEVILVPYRLVLLSKNPLSC